MLKLPDSINNWTGSFPVIGLCHFCAIVYSVLN